MIPNVLTIAGVDPSGGAGIAADLKTFSALGAYGMCVVTALTAQNTRAVTGVRLVEPAFVAEQIDAVFADVRVDAVKIGMLGTAEIAEVVAAALRRHEARHVVIDPVMVAKSGDRLLAEAAVEAVRTLLLPLAEVVTPNLPETAVLLGIDEPRDLAGMRAAAEALAALGPTSVLVKGGHLDGVGSIPENIPESIDVFRDGDTITELRAPRIATKNTHGTGCTLSAAIAALLPRMDRLAAVRAAKDYLTGALRAADELTVGTGHGPVHHFHRQWKT
jgi:hydroxymethylpyrimidine/phosphomethylpyrimidine kinase